jgi:hypothetical protein
MNTLPTYFTFVHNALDGIEPFSQVCPSTEYAVAAVSNATATYLLALAAILVHCLFAGSVVFVVENPGLLNVTLGSTK